MFSERPEASGFPTRHDTQQIVTRSIRVCRCQAVSGPTYKPPCEYFQTIRIFHHANPFCLRSFPSNRSILEHTTYLLTLETRFSYFNVRLRGCLESRESGIGTSQCLSPGSLVIARRCESASKTFLPTYQPIRQ